MILSTTMKKKSDQMYKSVTVVAFYNNFTIFFRIRKTYEQQPVGNNNCSLFENGWNRARVN